ncbi:hypothetical protein V5O48_015364 [Marasmius crinis-equi]|uniref:Uncharacterized protein n=1 Tax=Marasmius crinis-equi TaxID=585013 RepID=A0ABR3EUR3_9AGAR
MKLAAESEKPHKALFLHVNDTKANAECASNQWNTFLAYYNTKSDEKNPGIGLHRTGQPTFVTYKSVAASQVPEEDQDNLAAVQEAMSDVIQWQEEHLANYIESQKADPAKTKQMLQNMLTPFLKHA